MVTTIAVVEVAVAGAEALTVTPDLWPDLSRPDAMLPALSERTSAPAEPCMYVPAEPCVYVPVQMSQMSCMYVAVPMPQMPTQTDLELFPVPKRRNRTQTFLYKISPSSLPCEYIRIDERSRL